MTTEYDSIIIGAGLAGLTSAAELARRGRRVVVLERHSVVGGRARTDDLHGWLVNQGGHALYRSNDGFKTLLALGVEPSGQVPPLRGAQALVNGDLTPLPIGAASLLKSRALGGRGKLQFGKMLATLARLDATELANTSVDDWLRPMRVDTQAAVKALIRLSTYATAFDQMSAQVAVLQLRSAQDGVLYLHGGWGELCRQLAEVAIGHGAMIETGANVGAVERHDGRFRVVTADGDYVANTVIVAAGGPGFTAELLGLERDVFGDVGPAPQVASLDLALDSMPTHSFIVGIDEPTYFSVHSPPARLAPDGKVAAVAMRYLHPDDDAPAAAHRESLERIAALAGADRPVHTRFLARMTVAHGMPIANTGGLRGRPGLEVPGLGGAFVAGDWVGDRGILADASIASGYEAAARADALI